MLQYLQILIQHRLRRSEVGLRRSEVGLRRSERGLRRSEVGLATAELLGNAALGVAALVVIWAALRVLGLDIVTWIRGQVMG